MAFWAKQRGKTSAKEEREALTFLVLFLLACLPYANTLLGSFVYDDQYQVVENPYVHSFRYLPKSLGRRCGRFRALKAPQIISGR